MPGKSARRIVGYRYHIGMQLALCYGPVDKVIAFFVNDKAAWAGKSTGGTITVDAEALFGGEEREGGVSGLIDIEMGLPNQNVNGYLNANFSFNIPAFRGVCCAILRRLYIGNNPYLKPMAFKLVRTQIDTFGDPIWYQAKADINDGDMNPAHIIYEALTSSDFGMGYPTSSIDDANFRAVADALFAEGSGLSLQWLQQEQVEDFIGHVINHINGFLYVSPVTGLFNLKLVRNDYDANSLSVYNESCIVSLESFERRAWGETVNEINLVYRDRHDNKDKTITVQDTANIQFQGAVVNQTLQLPGISHSELAEKVALRELLAISSPLARVTLWVNRSAWSVATGDVFKFSWAKLGIVEQIYRVMRIDTGTLTDGAIKITAVEDVFSMPTAVYTRPQASGWTDPSVGAVNLTRQRVVEASYWDIQTKVCYSDIAFFTVGFGFLVALGSREAGVNFGYKLQTHVGSNPYNNQGLFPSCPSALITEALIQEVATTFHYSSARDLALVDLLIYAYIEEELVEIVAINEALGVITVNRGVVDTVPSAHGAGQIIYFSEMWSGRDKTEYTQTDIVKAKLLELTGQGALALNDATELSLTMTNRYARPYPPGNFKINGLRYPSSTSGDLVITWAHRDRTLQLAFLVDQTAANIGPEPKVTYTVLIYKTDGGDVLKHTESSILGTTWTYSQSQRITDFTLASSPPHSVRVELQSVRLGVISHQFHRCQLSVRNI